MLSCALTFWKLFRLELRIYLCLVRICALTSCTWISTICRHVYVHWIKWYQYIFTFWPWGIHNYYSYMRCVICIGAQTYNLYMFIKTMYSVCFSLFIILMQDLYSTKMCLALYNISILKWSRLLHLNEVVWCNLTWYPKIWLFRWKLAFTGTVILGVAPPLLYHWPCDIVYSSTSCSFQEVQPSIQSRVPLAMTLTSYSGGNLN